MALFRSLLGRIQAHLQSLESVRKEQTRIRLLLGRLLAAQAGERGPGDLDAFEFQVFSQFGEDGILQYLIRQTCITPEEEIFVEFGVENYTEANTRFLLMNDNWRGLVIDGSEKNIASIRGGDLYWRHDLTAVAAFITAENINDLIADAGFSGRIGLLSIDIDGNDYWIWEKISVVDPVIVVAEYNSVFGSARAVTTPYDPRFDRSRAHHSNLYWGASIKAFQLLGARKGYALVGSNSAGNNIFFVRRDRLGAIRELTPDEAHVASRFRDSRDAEKNLTFLSGTDRLVPIRDMPLVDIETGKQIRVGDLTA